MTERESLATPATEAAFLRSLADDLERAVAHIKQKLTAPTAQTLPSYREAREVLIPVERQIQLLHELAHTAERNSDG